MTIEERSRDASALQKIPQPADADRVAPRFRRLLIGVAVALLAVITIEQFELTLPFPLTRHLMQTQDVPVLILVAGLFLCLAAWRLPSDWGQLAERLAAKAPVNLIVTIGVVALLVALGTRFLVNDTPVSHDEIMSKFDTGIIASGRLMAPIPPEWRSLSWSLKPAFRLPVPGDVAWVSTYLPGNAALRALLGLVFNAALVNAVLVATALAALLGVARQLWPARPDAWFVTVVLAAASSQVLGMGLTPFAMTAHLALNLVWLWLFLRGTTAGHVAAIAVGFWATGLHQLIFHPIFVAPFILQMLFDRRWRLAALYIASYGAIGLFWIVYWQLLLSGHGIPPATASSMGISFFFERVASMLAYASWSGPETMVQNLLRFAAWQHPMLLVLLVPGIALGWRAGGVLRSLAAGIALTLLTMLILLPFQDIGWGYRYAHGLIGSAALLAAFGWISLTGSASASERQAAWSVMGVTTAVAVLLLLPVHAIQMYAYISPYTRANAAIAATKADAVVIETISVHNGIELVRNDPYLRNRPLVFDIGLLDATTVRELCSRMTVSVFDGAKSGPLGLKAYDPKAHPGYAQVQPIRTFLDSEECRQRRRTAIEHGADRRAQ